MEPIDPDLSNLFPRPISTSPATFSSPESMLAPPAAPLIQASTTAVVVCSQGIDVADVSVIRPASSSPSVPPSTAPAPVSVPAAPVAPGKGLANKDKVDTIHGPIQIPSLQGAWAKKLNSTVSTSRQPSRISRITPEWPSLSISRPHNHQIRHQQNTRNLGQRK
ncbi:unnamed protein product [Arabis nemorensis]|uniref:Uncharacterized protein n=1 Tax=Arabis nemorensis TaxID=586526 RepID=A0A565BM53_9BRAS|nr:unnamed protein product [Arabis nemorensis]